jgi:hypothetical protein
MASDSDAWNCKLSDGSYIGSSGRSYSLILGISGRGLIMIGLSAVCCSVLAVFLVIFGSEAAEGALFSSQIVLGTGVRFDLRGIMLEDRRNSVIHAELEEINAKTIKSWHVSGALMWH